MMERVHVRASRDYDVLIGEGLLDTCGGEIAAVTASRRCALVTDSTVAPLYARRVEASLQQAGMDVCTYVFPAGEQNKNLTTYGAILEFLAEQKLTRSDFVAALGGGVHSATSPSGGMFRNAVERITRREDRLKALAAELGESAAYLPSDVCSLDDMRALAALAKEKFGRVDVLFANAGIMPGSSMSELKVSDWMAMVDINVKGVLNAMAAVLPEFTAQKRGHIVVTSSMAGTKSVPGNAVYCGTKHFVRAMLDSFRMESIQEGTHIRTTTIYPGAIRTELLNTIAPSETKAMVEEFYKNVGLEPEVIANAVLYAVSQPDNVDVSDLGVRPSLEV